MVSLENIKIEFYCKSQYAFFPSSKNKTKKPEIVYKNVLQYATSLINY